MIRAVIIDDEMNGVRSLELLITKFIPDVKIVKTTTDALEGVQIINDFHPDIVFLDINMPLLNGFELLEKLEFKNFHLIFSTAHQEYGLKALKLNASDYLLKPIEIQELKTAVDKIRLKIKENTDLPNVMAVLKKLLEIRDVRVPLSSKNNIEYVSSDKVLYIEASSNHSVVILTNGNKEIVNTPLKEYEVLLCKTGSHFMRIHNSFIINMHYVTRYIKEDGGYVEMNDKKTIPISKYKKEEFIKAINLAVD